MALRNGVVTAWTALGIASKWKYDVERSCFEPIIRVRAANGEKWFYAWNYGAYPADSATEQGDEWTIIDILSYLVVPQSGAPAGVHFRSFRRPPWMQIWLPFPRKPTLEEIINDALLSQSKARLKAKLVNLDLTEIIDSRRSVRYPF